MLEQIRIKNYRALQSFEMKRLGTINLIGGKNNTGKTTLLEAVFLALAAGRPEAILSRNVTRMPDPGPNSPTPDAFEQYWYTLFSGLDNSRTIQVDLTVRNFGNIQVSLFREHAMRDRFPLDALLPSSTTSVANTHQLAIRLETPEAEKWECSVRVGPEGFTITGQEPPPIPTSVAILLPGAPILQDDVVKLAKLRTEMKHAVVLDVLRTVEPRLIGLEDSMAAGAPGIWADVGLGRLVPLSVLGNGMVRLVQIILAMYGIEHGVLLIDEVEAGLHHSVLSRVWEATYEAARTFDVQVIATTHSYEMLRAACESIPHDSFLYHRIERREGESKCITYPPEDFPFAFKHDLEVR